MDHVELARLLSRSPTEEEMFIHRSDAMVDTVTYKSCREVWALGVLGEQRALTHSDELWMAYRLVKLARQSAAERTPLTAPPPTFQGTPRQDLTLIEEELGFRVITHSSWDTYHAYGLKRLHREIDVYAYYVA